MHLEELKIGGERDVFTYLGDVILRILRGEKLSFEDIIASAFLGLGLVALAVPLAIEAAAAAYDYAKKKGWIK